MKAAYSLQILYCTSRPGRVLSVVASTSQPRTSAMLLSIVGNLGVRGWSDP
jgi:hypothetical protein